MFYGFPPTDLPHLLLSLFPHYLFYAFEVGSLLVYVKAIDLCILTLNLAELSHFSKSLTIDPLMFSKDPSINL